MYISQTNNNLIIFLTLQIRKWSSRPNYKIKVNIYANIYILRAVWMIPASFLHIIKRSLVNLSSFEHHKRPILLAIQIHTPFDKSLFEDWWICRQKKYLVIGQWRQSRGNSIILLNIAWTTSWMCAYKHIYK